MARVMCWGVVCALACGGSADVGEMREQWSDSAPERYVVKTCNTGFAARVCNISAVERQQPVLTEEQHAQGTWTPVQPPVDLIGRLFDRAESATSCERSVTADSVYGYPSDVYFNCGEEGSGVEVACFAADTLELETCR